MTEPRSATLALHIVAIRADRQDRSFELRFDETCVELELTKCGLRFAISRHAALDFTGSPVLVEQAAARPGRWLFLDRPIAVELTPGSVRGGRDGD